ncbi:hypothetical protein WKI40_20105 [Kosakonia sacchari]|uniref:hypothetical protein n=1 Tax=Kosakonia sacchari TaxID=1158459 RepID=UPI0030C19B85
MTTATEFLTDLYAKDFVKTSRTLRRLKTYNGVKVSLEMVLTYDLIASFNRDQCMTNGHVKPGKPSAFGQAELADFLMCSIKTAGRTIAAMKNARLIECVGRGPHDVDLLVCLPLEDVNTVETTQTPKPSLTRSQRRLSAVQPEVAKPIELQTVETVENAGTYQPGITECGSEVVHSRRTEQTRNVKLGHSGLSVQPPVISDSIREAANDDVRSNNPVISYLPDSKVILIDGVAVKYLEPEETDSDQYGVAF